MDIAVSSITLVTFYQITRRHIPEANNLQLLYISVRQICKVHPLSNSILSAIKE
jgi:hypothetical protein